MTNNRLFLLLKPLLFYILLLVFTFWQCILLMPEEASFTKKLIYVAFQYLFYLLLSQTHKWLLNGFIVFSLLLTIFIYPTLVIYGEPTLSYITSIVYTDTQEAGSYLKVISPKIYITLLGLIALGLILCFYKYDKIKIKFFSIALFVIVIFLPAKKALSYGIKWGYADKYFNILTIDRTLFIAQSLKLIKEDYDYLQKEIQKEDTWVIENPEKLSLKDNFVIVIGESVRRDFLNAYGFSGDDNTPFINGSNNILFSNYISAAPKTILSLTRTLALSNDSHKYELNNNIITLANKVGYETYWVSNQGQTGHHNSATTSIALKTNQQYFLRKGDGKVGDNPHDTNLLPHIKKIINQKSNKPKLIIVHTVGSHPYVCDRIKNKPQKSILSEEISCYNQSIKELDAFLGDIHQALDHTKRSFNMVYFSDHGQTTNGEAIYHGQQAYKENYDVPLIVWGETNSKRVSAKRHGSDFLHLFSELNNIKTQNLKRNYSFISDTDFSSDRKVLDANEKSINYEKMNSNEIHQFLNKK